MPITPTQFLPSLASSDHGFHLSRRQSDFTAPNGIIYRWDGNKWAVKAFRSTEDFIVELGDDPPDTPKEGDLWYDTKEEELTLYIWTGKVWVPSRPTCKPGWHRGQYCQRRRAAA